MTSNLNTNPPPTFTLPDNGGFTVTASPTASSTWVYAPPVTGTALFNVAAVYLNQMYLQPIWNNSVLGPNFQPTSSRTSIDWGDGIDARLIGRASRVSHFYYI